MERRKIKNYPLYTYIYAMYGKGKNRKANSPLRGIVSFVSIFHRALKINELSRNNTIFNFEKNSIYWK